MYKGKINLGSISKMRISFNLILDNEDEMKIKNSLQKDGIQKLISKFQYMGSTYLRITPYPYITLDISRTGDRNDEWNSANTVNLNRMGIFLLMRALKNVIKRFYEEKSLYFIRNGQLMLNTEIARNYVTDIRFPNNNSMRIEYAVIPDVDNQEVFYEGVNLHLNKSGNFVQLTYLELEYFYHEISKYDLMQMSFNLIITDLLTKNNEIKQIQKVVSEKDEVAEEVDTKPLPKIQPSDTLPNL